MNKLFQSFETHIKSNRIFRFYLVFGFLLLTGIVSSTGHTVSISVLDALLIISCFYIVLVPFVQGKEIIFGSAIMTSSGYDLILQIFSVLLACFVITHSLFA